MSCAAKSDGREHVAVTAGAARGVGSAVAVRQAAEGIDVVIGAYPENSHARRGNPARVDGVESLGDALRESAVPLRLDDLFDVWQFRVLRHR